MPFLQTPGTKFRVHWEGEPVLRWSPALSVSSFSVAKGLRMSPANWHLPRALPATEQGHLPSASVEIEPCAALAVDLQRPPEGVQGGVRTVCSRESGGTGL